MKALAYACLVAIAIAILSSALPTAAQSTTTPAAAPLIPPGETPPEAARNPPGRDIDATPGKSKPAKTAPNRDPPRDESR